MEAEYRFDPDDLGAHEYWLRFRDNAPEGRFVAVHDGGYHETTKRSLVNGTLRWIALADPNLVLRMRLRSCSKEERCSIEMPECFFRCCLPPRHPGLHVAQTKEHEYYYGPIVAARYSIQVIDPLKEVDLCVPNDLWW